MQARGPASDAEFQVVQPIPPDAFDRWNDDRDRFILGSQSYQHVSPAISGSEDLDQNGQWVQDPNYGQVWQPSGVGPDWAPYQNGRWVWEDYYGWTWVSADPWGWAPYHYGRWFMGLGGWAWYPGPILANPFWAPAYVGFFGFGGGFGGLGVGFYSGSWKEDAEDGAGGGSIGAAADAHGAVMLADNLVADPEAEAGAGGFFGGEEGFEDVA